MKGLTLTAPYGTLISIAERWPELGKHHETRSWPTSYRGWLAIHQGKGLGPVGGATGLDELCASEPFFQTLRAARLERLNDLPRGAIVAVAWLQECYEIRPSALWAHSTTRPLPRGNDRAFGDYTPGRYAWHLTRIRALPAPVACTGAQGLWMVPAAAEAAVWAQVGQVAA